MKRILLYTFVLLLTLTFGINALAVYDSQGKRVFDFEELLSEREQEDLQGQIDKLSQKLDLDIVIVTIGDADGKSSRAYADDFYDAYDFGTMSAKGYPSGILLLLDMDNREVYLSTKTEQEARFADREIEAMLDSIYDHIANGNYYKACTAFLQGVETYGVTGTYQYPEGTKDPGAPAKNSINIWLRLLISLAIGGIGVTMMVFNMKAKVTADKRTYLSNRGIDILKKEDRFTHTTVVTRKIQTNKDSGGSSGGSGARTHTSSSGRSHGGGGRKF